MACATISLKRGHDFDPLSPRRPKRRRCVPMTISPTATSVSKPVSVFKEATPSYSKEQLADTIRSEIKRLQHRRQLTVHASPSQSDSGSDSELLQSSTSRASAAATSTSQTSHQQKKDNLPLFTFKQMTTLCEKMVRDRTEQLCEEYDQVLATKLSEQYESFLKFNHDQIQKHFSKSTEASSGGFVALEDLSSPAIQESFRTELLDRHTKDPLPALAQYQPPATPCQSAI